MRRPSEQSRRLQAQPVTDLDVADAVRIVDDSGLAPIIDACLRKHRGRPRAYSARTLLSLLMLTALAPRGGLHMTSALRIGWGLKSDQLAQLGCEQPIAYSAVESFISDLSRAFDEHIDLLTGEVHPPMMSITLLEFMNRLVRASVKGIHEPPTLAIDSFPSEGWGRRRSWKNTAGRPSRSGEPAPDPAWPRHGVDGELRHSHDPDARDVYIASKNLAPKAIGLGYEVHLLCDTNARGEVSRPPLCRGINYSPGGTSRTGEALALLDTIQALGSPIDTLIADRGYTNATVENWALPLSQRRIRQIQDIHPQRGKVAMGPIPGTIVIDGTLFVDWMPKELWDLPRRQINDSAESIATLCRRYDERIPYAFSTKGEPDWERGVQQYRGPATTSRVRCASMPDTMRLAASKPECPAGAQGAPCACKRQPSMGPGDNLLLRQEHLYGTTHWKADYSRRNSIESLNASVSHHHGSFERNAIRLFGRSKRSIFAVLSITATNVHLMRSRYAISPSQIAEGQVIHTPLVIPATKETLNRAAFRPRAVRRHQPVELPAPEGQTPPAPRTIPL